MIKKIISKKGSHVGVVVSFVIFVTFLVFLYTIIQPATAREKDKSYILDYITLNLIGSSTGNMTTLKINISESTGNQDCLNMHNFPEIPENMRENLLITNSLGDALIYEISSSGDVLIGTGDYFSGILNVYFSSEITGNLGTLEGCYPINEDYTIIIKTFSEIFETKMYELNESYYEDYESLKIALGIPKGTEFNFYILDSLRNVIISAKMQEPPTDRSVFVQETPIQYVDENGDKMFGFLKVEVW